MRRKPRPGAVAPVVAGIERILIDWHACYKWQFTAEASHAAFENFFFKKLQTGHEALDAVYIVGLARRGHPAADRALRRCIIEANEADRFPQLPTSVRAYNSELLLRAPAAVGYGSQSPQVVNNYIRDYVIGALVDVVKARYPQLPVLYSSKQRRSVASLVGTPFNLEEPQVRRIYRAHRAIPRMVAEFFRSYTLTNGSAPFVR